MSSKLSDGAQSGLPPTCVSLAELARALGVSRKTVRRALHRARIGAYVISDARNGTIRYRRAEVMAWLDQQREQH